MYTIIYKLFPFFFILGLMLHPSHPLQQQKTTSNCDKIQSTQTFKPDHESIQPLQPLWTNYTTSSATFPIPIG